MTSLPCPPALWPRFSTLLDAALDLPADDRTTWLDSLSGDDTKLKPWLARVLGSEAGLQTGFLHARPDLVSDATFVAGGMVGPYRLESRLGEGGMGEVWRASRADDGPRREVALKLPHAELLGGPFRQRFARERDVLAALSHPHIAHLYDAGLSADGHPYLALELVEGQPITEACRAEQASLARRVELICQMLAALTYAHQRLIVHRDIKPNNVLVTSGGGVKLLDFGIAKLLRPDAPGEVALTQSAAHLATPGYAAPEQIYGGAITVATDIFAAGVLLFELCTGTRPFARVPSEADGPSAPLASYRARALAAGAPEGSRLPRLLRGDMDAIIARALALAPSDRYSSAEAFARDLLRWRNGLPVAARRVGFTARALKFARRNKAGVALATVLALALAGGTAGIAWQARLAAREAARATAVKNYLIGLFEQANPHGGGKPSETMTVKELLDRGADQADAALAGQPEIEMELLYSLGGIYDALEDPKRSMQVASRRLELARTLYGVADTRVINATMDLATSKEFFLDSAGARVLMQSIRAPVFNKYGAHSLERARWLATWADSLRTTHGGRNEALADARLAVDIYQARFPTDPEYPNALYILSGYQYDAEQYDAALRTLQQREKVRAVNGDNDTIYKLMYMTQSGNILRRLGRYDEAEKLLQEAQALAERVVGRQSTWYLSSLTSRAVMANGLGQRGQAMALFSQAMAIVEGKGATTGQVTSLHRGYGGALAADGDAAAAIPLLEDALQQAQLHPRDESNVRITQGYLGDAYDQAGRTDQARALLQTARDDWVRYGVPDGALTLGGRERWARFLLDHGEPGAARTECTQILRIAAGAPSAPAARARADLARIALAAGDSAMADRLSTQALQTIEAVALDYDVRARIDIWLARAEILLAAGQVVAARALAQQAVTAAEQYDAPASPQLARARAALRKSS
jgi:serine/threonine-protein kinase